MKSRASVAEIKMLHDRKYDPISENSIATPSSILANSSAFPYVRLDIIILETPADFSDLATSDPHHLLQLRARSCLAMVRGVFGQVVSRQNLQKGGYVRY